MAALFTAGGDCRFKLSLRVRHPDADLTEFCRQLGVEATRVWRAGEGRATKTGTSLTGTQKESYCTVSFLDGASANLPREMHSVLSKLRKHKQTLKQITDSGGEISLFIGWFCDFNCGGTLSWNLLSELAELRVSLEFDVYGRGEPTPAAGYSPATR